MDFNDLTFNLQAGKYRNQRVLPLQKYENSKYSDYKRDTKLFMEEQERVDTLFVEDCRRALEGYMGRGLSREQWRVAFDYIWMNAQGLTHIGIVNKLSELAPVLDQFLLYHKSNRRKKKSHEVQLSV